MPGENGEIEPFCLGKMVRWSLGEMENELKIFFLRRKATFTAYFVCSFRLSLLKHLIYNIYILFSNAFSGRKEFGKLLEYLLKFFIPTIEKHPDKFKDKHKELKVQIRNNFASSSRYCCYIKETLK